MNLLAIDTAHAPGLALFKKGELVGEKVLEKRERQAEALHEAIRDLFKECRMKPQEVQALAVGLGPGSFTGLRIGVTAAAVWAWTRRIPLYGFSRLEAVGRLLLCEEKAGASVWVVEIAGRGNVYEACYSRTRAGRVSAKVKPRLKPKKNQALTPEIDAATIASELGRMALEKAARPLDPFRVRPLYIYPKDCNVT